jgi:fido (protein-threonine AMPylation protein)
MDYPIEEGLLTANRIRELEVFPVVGTFDSIHLRTIHSRIFQDLPHHHPGQFRREASAWVKARELESRATSITCPMRLGAWWNPVWSGY